MSRPDAEGTETRRDAVLRVLSDLEWHDGAELERVGGNRYSARVDELRALGYVVDPRSTDAGKFDEYRLASTTPGAARTQKVRVDFTEWELDQLFSGKTPESVREKLNAARERLYEKKAKMQQLRDQMPSHRHEDAPTQATILETLLEE